LWIAFLACLFLVRSKMIIGFIAILANLSEMIARNGAIHFDRIYLAQIKHDYSFL